MADTTSTPLSVADAAQALVARLSGTEPAALQPDNPATPEAPADTPDSPETPATEQPAEPTYTVRVNGEEIQVPLPDLIQGYSRTADYTRKTQDLAEQRKAFEAEAQTLRAQRQSYDQALGEVQHALQALTPTEPNWNELRATLKPEDYSRAVDTWREQSRRLDAVKSERQRNQQQMVTDATQQAEALRRQEFDKLHNAVPEWVTDRQKAQADLTGLVTFAKTRGFTDDELKNVIDHRAWLLLRDAKRWQDAQAGIAAVKAKTTATPKTLTPGAPVNREASQTEAQKTAAAKLKKTGRVGDAAALIAGFIE